MGFEGGSIGPNVLNGVWLTFYHYGYGFCVQVTNIGISFEVAQMGGCRRTRIPALGIEAMTV